MIQTYLKILKFLLFCFGISTIFCINASQQQVESTTLQPISVTINGEREVFYYIKVDHQGVLDDTDLIEWCEREGIVSSEHETVLAAARRQFELLSDTDRLQLLYERFKFMHGSYSGETKSIDLGCGSKKPRNPFDASIVYGIDIRNDIGAGIYKADLVTEPIPFSNGTFHYVTAYDILEHIPRLIYTPGRRYAFVELMNEIYRVMKVEGKFLSFTPAWPHESAFVDPTHVNFITELTFLRYFDDQLRWASAYGFYGAFKIVMQKWVGEHLMTIMEKVQSSDCIECF